MKKVPILTADDLGTQTFLLDETQTYVVKTEDVSIQKTPTGLLFPKLDVNDLESINGFVTTELQPGNPAHLAYNGMDFEIRIVEGIELTLRAATPFTAMDLVSNNPVTSTMDEVNPALQIASIILGAGYWNFTYRLNNREVVLRLLMGKYGWHLEVIADFEFLPA